MATTTAARDTHHDEDLGSWTDQTKKFLISSKLNILFVFVPFAILFGTLSLSQTVAFVAAFLGLIPLAQALGDLTEDIAKRTNPATAALINVTFGNATEVIVSLVALRLGQLDIIKYSLMGSVIGNMLLVTGSSLVAAGFKTSVVRFNTLATSSFLTMLLFASFCFVVPSAYNTIAPGAVSGEFLVSVSRQLSAIMIAVYVAYLYFQHKTHAYLFDGEPVSESPTDDATAVEMVQQTALNTTTPPCHGASPDEACAESEVKSPGHTAVVITDAEPEDREITVDETKVPPASVIVESAPAADDDDDEKPDYTMNFAVCTTAIATVLISLLSDYLVSSLDGAAQSLKISPHFIALVIIATVGNVAEHAGAIMMACRNKMDIAVSISFGSSVQISMLVFPFICICGVAFDQPLDLSLTPFLLGSVFASTVLTFGICNQGCATWLNGMQLLATWAIIVLAYLNAPE